MSCFLPSRLALRAAKTALVMAALLPLLFPAFARAQSSGGGYGGYPGGTIDCHVPYSSTPMPAYFSGTSCTIQGKASVSSGYLTRVELWVGGTLVSGKDYTSAQNMPAAGPSVTFDSTHFGDGSTITVTIKAWASGGRTNSHTNSAPAYNKYAVLAADEFEHHSVWGYAAAPKVRSVLQSPMNHGPGYYSDGGWTCGPTITDPNSPFRLAVKNATAFHFSAHGATTSIWDDSGGINLPINKKNIIGSTRVGDMMNLRSSTLPPITIVFAASCSTSAGGPDYQFSFASKLGILSTSVNRAYIGFNKISYIKGAQRAAEMFWQSLASGYVVETAKVKAQVAFDAEAKIAPSLPVRIAPGCLDAVLVRTGDPYAKLHGVYRGNQQSDGKTEWFVLP